MLWQLAKCCEMWASTEEWIRDALVIGTVDKEPSLKSRVQSDNRGNYYYNLSQFISKQDTEPEWTWGWTCLLAIQKERRKKVVLHKENGVNSVVLLHKKQTCFYLHSRKGENSNVQKSINQQSCSLSVKIQGKGHFKVFNYIWRTVWDYSSMPDYKMPRLKSSCCNLHLTSLDLW